MNGHFLFSTLYMSLPRDLIKLNKTVSLIQWCLTEIQKAYLFTSDKSGFLVNKKYTNDTCKC